MQIFTKQLGNVNYSNPQEALRELSNHIRRLQEDLEYTLSHLDSSNLVEIDPSQTDIVSATGGVRVSENGISLKGKNGESFEVGVGDDGTFRFALNGKNGEKLMYLDDEGNLVITQ